MKMCMRHWEMLKDAVKQAGLWHLVSSNGEEAARRGEEDPLVRAYIMITGRALEQGGTYLMETKEDGSSYCPICEAVAHTNEDDVAELEELGHTVESWWTEGPVKAIRETKRQH